jgi:pimeloyl-ACP methyl ester carboxylesterase
MNKKLFMVTGHSFMYGYPYPLNTREHVFADLFDEVKTLAYDGLNQGKSPSQQKAQLKEEIINLTTEFDDVYLLGTSAGGHLAIHLAMALPCVKGIVTISAPTVAPMFPIGRFNKPHLMIQAENDTTVPAVNAKLWKLWHKGNVRLILNPDMGHGTIQLLDKYTKDIREFFKYD